MRIIHKYIDQLLKPFLRHYIEAGSIQERMVTGDIEKRLGSIFANWHDQKFKSAILLPGVELSAFWKPQNIDIEVRTAVVVGVRNSIIEELHTIAPSISLFTGVTKITQEAMSYLTSASCRFFQDEFSNIAIDSYKSSTDDLFFNLSRTYLAAWRRLELIASSSDQEIGVPEILENLKIERFPESTFDRITRIIDSGYRPQIDGMLGANLNMISDGKIPCFYTPSFKHLSRNPEKLLRTIEHVLACRVPFITNNYFISREYVLKRSPLVNGSARALKQSFKGLSSGHRDWLQMIYKSI